MKFNIILLFIIIVISNYSIADNIFEPNQLPNIEIIENKNIEIDERYKNKLSILQKNRFFVMYSYQNLLQNNIKCQSIEINEYIENFKILIKELDRYKLEFFKQIDLNYLVLCSNLQLENYYTAGIPNNKVSTLIFDIALDKNMIARSIHHEIFHMIKQNKKNEKIDNLYANINDKGFNYEDCSVCSNNLDITFTNQLNGFVSSYASNTLEEDQAELYAAIMTIDNFDNFYINDDRIIKKKKLIENYYLKFLK